MSVNKSFNLFSMECSYAVSYFYLYAVCHYPEGNYSECHYAEWHYDEFHDAECH